MKEESLEKNLKSPFKSRPKKKRQMKILVRLKQNAREDSVQSTGQTRNLFSGYKCIKEVSQDL